MEKILKSFKTCVNVISRKPWNNHRFYLKCMYDFQPQLNIQEKPNCFEFNSHFGNQIECTYLYRRSFVMSCPTFPHPNVWFFLRNLSLGGLRVFNMPMSYFNLNQFHIKFNQHSTNSEIERRNLWHFIPGFVFSYLIGEGILSRSKYREKALKESVASIKRRWWDRMKTESSYTLFCVTCHPQQRGGKADATCNILSKFTDFKCQICTP